MAAPVLQSREQADHLYQMLKAGQVAPEKQEEAATALREFMRAEQEMAKQQAMADKLNSMIDNTPREGVVIPQFFPVLFPGQPAVPMPQPTADKPTREYFLNQAAEHGLDVHTGLPVSDRGRAALLSFDPDMQMATLDHLVRTNLKRQGVDLPAEVPVVFQDETTAEAFYLRPEKGKLVRTLINPAGVDKGDLIELGPEAFSFAVETGGAIGGAAVGTVTSGPGVGTAVGGAAGAAGGLFASYEVRRAAAKMFGIPEELADNADIAFSDLAWAAGGELGGAAIMGTVRAVRNLGRPLVMKDLPRLKAKYMEKLRLVKSLEDKLGSDIQLSPSIGELTEDPVLQVIEADLRRHAKGSAALAQRSRDVELKKNYGRAFMELADANGVRTPMDLRPVEEVSAEVKDRARSSVEAVKQQRAEMQTKADELAEYFEESPDMQLFRDIRDGTAASAARAKEVSDRAWDAYRTEVGWDPKTRVAQLGLANPKNSHIRQYMQQLDEDRRQALMVSLAKSKEAFLKDAGFGSEEVEQLTGVAQNILDMRHLHFMLTHLKRQIRQIDRSVDPNATHASDIRGLINAIETQIKDTPIVSRNGRMVSAEKQARVRLAWDDANDATRNMHEQFDTKNMTEMLATHRVKNPETGRWEDELSMNPAAVRAAIFRPGDTRFMQEALEANGNNPATKAALARQLMRQYRDTVFKDGVPQQARHNDFMTNFQDHMDILFSPSAAARINNAGDFAREMRRLDAQVQKLEVDIQKQFGRRVTDPLNSMNIAKEMLTDRVGPEQARNVIRMLDEFDPELAKQVRGHVIQEAFFRSVGKNDIVNSRNLTKILKDNGATFDALFGAGYRQDLEKLAEVVKLMDQRSMVKAPPMEVQTWWLQLTRSVFGPLSRKQRFITAVNSAARRLAGKRADELMANPDKLNAFIKLSKMTPTDPRFLGLVTFIGLEEAIDEDTMSLARRAAETHRALPTGTRGIAY